MGKILIFRPIDIYYELVRSQFQEYRNAIEMERKMSRVVVRLLRIQLIYQSLTPDQRLYIQETYKDCYQEFQKLIPIIRQMNAEPLEMSDSQLIQSVMIDSTYKRKPNSIFDLFNIHPEINKNNVSKILKDSFNQQQLKYIRIFQKKDDFYIQSRQVKSKGDSYSGTRAKRGISLIIFNALNATEKKEFYKYTLRLIGQLSSKIKEDFILSGGTGQFISILKNNIQNPNNTFKFEDIDVKIKPTSNTQINTLREQIIYFFSNIIHSNEVPKICKISMQIGDYLLESAPVSYYRNIKIKPKYVQTYYRFKKTKVFSPFLFDVVDLYVRENINTAIIFRLFINLKITDQKKPNLSRIVQLEVLDISIALQDNIQYNETHELSKANTCAQLFQNIQEFEKSSIKEIKSIISQHL